MLQSVTLDSTGLEDTLSKGEGHGACEEACQVKQVNRSDNNNYKLPETLCEHTGPFY